MQKVPSATFLWKNLPLQDKAVVTMKFLNSVHFLLVSEALANDIRFVWRENEAD